MIRERDLTMNKPTRNEFRAIRDDAYKVIEQIAKQWPWLDDSAMDFLESIDKEGVALGYLNAETNEETD